MAWNGLRRQLLHEDVSVAQGHKARQEPKYLRINTNLGLEVYVSDM
jgi:hypothetical protein